MESSQDDSLVMVKLADGEDLFPSLEAAARRHGIESGAVLWGIGMIQDFELGFFKGPQYERHAFRDRHELLALHGSISLQAEPRLHLHVAAGKPDYAVVGGHLFRAKACVVNEICLAKFEGLRLTRVLNPTTGLRELVLPP